MGQNGRKTMVGKTLLHALKTIAVWSVCGALLGIFAIIIGMIVGQRYKNFELVSILAIAFGAIGLFQAASLLIELNWRSSRNR